MKKQKKQAILNAIIVILVLALIMMIGSIVYEEKINMSKQPIQNTNAPAIENEEEKDQSEDEVEVGENDNTVIQEDDVEDNEEIPNEDEENQEYVGEEENKTEEPEMTTDEKVIDLVKKEWGKDDSVTFSIEKRNGTKYRVAVRNSSTTVLQWYEVDTETWKVSEY